MFASAALAQQGPNSAPGNVLPELLVNAPRLDGDQTTAGAVRGYQALTSRSATKSETPIEQIPQSIQVVPRKLIEDQGALTQSEVFRNVSGVQPIDPLFPGQLGPKLRGFAGERFVDGLPNYYDYGARDLLIGVERIEFLKGPSSILYQGGTSPLGGVINVISKMPTTDRFALTGITAGGYRYWSPYFDVNQPLTDNRTILFRMTGQYERTGSNIDTVVRRSFALNPVLTLTNNTGTTLSIQGHISQRRQPDYSGLPAVGAIDQSGYSIRRNMFVGDPEIERTDSRTMSVTGRLEHAFNDMISFFVTARASKSRFREPSQFTFSNTPDFAPSTFALFNGMLSQDQSEISVNPNVLIKFDWGPTKNRVLFGFDYNRVTDRGFLNADIAGFVDLANPAFPKYVEPAPGPFTSFSNIDNSYVQLGGTLQLQSTLWNRLHLLGALRVAHVDIKSREYTTNATFRTSETKLLPRIGATYDVLDGVSIFASYVEGLRAVPFFNGPTAPKPEGSRQVEGGIKLNFGFGLSGTLAGFEITRTNVAVTPPGSLVQVQTGEQRSHGFEADLLWQPNRSLSILASFAHVNATITKDANPTLVGQALTGVPRNSGRLWVNYAFVDGPLQGLSLGGGIYAASRQAFELANPLRTDAYYSIDAKASYTFRALTVSIVAKNLTNNHYLVPYPYLSGRVAPADGRTIYGTATFKF